MTCNTELLSKFFKLPKAKRDILYKKYNPDGTLVNKSYKDTDDFEKMAAYAVTNGKCDELIKDMKELVEGKTNVSNV